MSAEPTTVCPLCKIACSNRHLLPEHDKPVIETESFIVVPAMGQLLEGYLLVSPKQHSPNLASLSTPLLVQLAKLKERVRSLIFKEFGEYPIFFEHGPGLYQQTGGSCIDHSHLHVLPMTISSPPSLITDHLHGGRIKGFSEVIEYATQGKPYFYFECSNKSMYLFDANDLPCQFGRKVIARILGCTDEWDWAIFPYHNRMIKTSNRLLPHLRDGEAFCSVFFAQPVDSVRRGLISKRFNNFRNLTEGLPIEILAPYVDEPDTPSLNEISQAIAKRIVSKDYKQIDKCDVFVADLSGNGRQPVGMIFEVARAASQGKHIIIYTGNSKLGNRVWIKAFADSICTTWGEVRKQIRLSVDEKLDGLTSPAGTANNKRSSVHNNKD